MALKGHGFTGGGKILIRVGFGEGHDFSRAVKSLKMCPRFSARGLLFGLWRLFPLATFSAACLAAEGTLPTRLVSIAKPYFRASLGAQDTRRRFFCSLLEIAEVKAEPFSGNHLSDLPEPVPGEP
jgi:hypothetical protein